MKILHGLISLLFWVMLLVTGILLITGFWGAHSFVIDFLTNHPTDRLIVGAILVLLVVIYALTAVPPRQTERFVSYDSDGGRVNISVKAVNHYLSKLANEFAGVMSLRANIVPQEKLIRLDMNVKAGAKIQELSQAVQQRVREGMSDTLGIPDVRSIQVFIREIVVPDEASSGEQDAQAEWQNMSV